MSRDTIAWYVCKYTYSVNIHTCANCSLGAGFQPSPLLNLTSDVGFMSQHLPHPLQPAPKSGNNDRPIAAHCRSWFFWYPVQYFMDTSYNLSQSKEWLVAHPKMKPRFWSILYPSTFLCSSVMMPALQSHQALAGYHSPGFWGLWLVSGGKIHPESISVCWTKSHNKPVEVVNIALVTSYNALIVPWNYLFLEDQTKHVDVHPVHSLLNSFKILSDSIFLVWPSSWT